MISLIKHHSPSQEHSTPIYSLLDGDESLREPLYAFSQTLPDKVEHCRTYINNKAWLELKKYAHQIKGSFGSYGYPELQRLASEMEELCELELTDEGKSAAAGKLLELLDSLSMRAQKAF